ncbi:MAG: hypothetical protein R6V31_09080 [Halohasta sp.]
MTPFQTAVKSNVPDAQRREAIDDLASNNRTTKLAVLVRTSGLSGGLRRRAVDGLISCGADDLLDELAADRSVAPELRRKAER